MAAALVPLHSLPLAAELTVAHSFVVTREQVVAFAKEWDPLAFHLYDEDARRIGLRGVSAPGAFVHAMSIKMRHAALAWDGKLVGHPVAGLEKHFRTKAPVYPGDTLTLRGRLLEHRTSSTNPTRHILKFRWELTNQDGVLVYEEDDTVMSEGVISKL